MNREILKRFQHRMLISSIILCAMWIFGVSANAQLSVEVSLPKSEGRKAVIKLVMKNSFSSGIKSARAAVFVSDDQGTMIGQASRWVIGGTKDRPALNADKETTYNFVVQTPNTFSSTNVTVRVNFTSVTLEDGARVDIRKDVSIVQKKN